VRRPIADMECSSFRSAGRQICRRGRGLDDDSPRARRGEAGEVGGDAGNGVGCGLGGVDLDGGHRGAVHVRLNAEVAVLLRGQVASLHPDDCSV
jgi:hypothetical protein